MPSHETLTTEIVIQPLTADSLEAHVAEITEIYAVAVRDSVATVELAPPSVAEMFARIANNLEAGYPAFVALDKSNRVAGYTYGGSFRAAAAFRPAMEPSVYVVQTLVGRGVGRRLLASLIEAATARDFRQMIAVVEASQAGSLAFHEALGFVEVGRLRSLAHKHDQWCTAVFLQLTLGDGDSTPPMT